MTAGGFYLGPWRPRSILDSWEQIEMAAAGGLLGEGQWIELKKDLGPAKREVNVELARDLAALSLDGGLLIFGVTDDQRVTGCDPAQLVTRVSQVASTAIQPPLSPVIHDPVFDPTGSRAVLVVEVPPSADAPHMVDGRYWGRSSDGKRPLSDAEVRRLLAAKAGSEAGFHERLQDLVRSDPIARFVDDGSPRHGHLFILAEPCTPVLHRDPSVPADVIGHVRRLKNPTQWFGSLADCDRNAHDPDGEARLSLNADSSVTSEYERSLAYISVKDDCNVVVVSGGATSSWDRPEGTTVTRVLHSLVALITVQTMQLLRDLSLESWLYTGQWRVGLHISNLSGEMANVDSFAFRPVMFAAPSYTRIAVVSPATWTDDGDAQADQLLRGFFRGLGLQNWTLAQILAR